jgi:ketosteroid isomerase-like protein
MARDTLETLRAGYDAFAGGDMSAVLALLEPGVEVAVHVGPDADTYHGREGFLANLERMREVFDEFEIEPEEFVTVGDRVVVPFRVHGRGRGSGVYVEQRRAHLWTLHEGRAVRLDVFADPREAHEAATAAAGEPREQST